MYKLIYIYIYITILLLYNVCDSVPKGEHENQTIKQKQETPVTVHFIINFHKEVINFHKEVIQLRFC